MVYINNTGKHNEVWLDKPYATINVECPDCPSTEDAYSSGYTDGREEGYHKGYQSGSTDGWNDGYPSGYTDGQASVDCTESYNSGITDGIAEQKAKLIPTAITENGTYNREDGWSTITVDIPSDYQEGYGDGEAAQKAKLTVTSFTENNTYTRENGWSAVTVAVPSDYQDGYDDGFNKGKEAQKGKLTYLSVNQNGTFTREDGWSAITVDIPSDYQDGYDNGAADQKAKLISTAITENGIYSREDGYSSIEVNVPTGETINNQNISKGISASDLIYADGHYIGSQTITHLPDYTGIEKVDLNIDIVASAAIEQGYNNGYTSGYTDGLNACSGGSEDLIANLQGDYFIIPEGTTKLRDYAFYAAPFSSITIPSSVTTIGSYAFSTTKLTGITIPSSVHTIMDYAFENTRLQEIVVPDTVSTLGAYTFNRCKGLTAATLPSGLTEIPNYLFTNCSLTGITLPASITSIGINAFVRNNLTGNITIPSGVTYINEGAFRYCSGLTSMTFESPVPATIITTADYTASLGSSAYTWSIYVPCEAVEDYKTAWSYYAHRIMCNSGDTPDTGDTGYTPFSVSGDITNKFVYSGDSVQTVKVSSSGFLDFVTSMYVNGEQITPVSAITMEPGKTYYIDYYTNTIYDYVPYGSFNGTDVVETEIRGRHITQLQGCYGGCYGLTSATLSSAITEIRATFLNCLSLTSVNLGNHGNGLIVRDDSFRNCSSLAYIEIFPALIGNNAFAGSGIRNFFITDICTSIGSAAFSACTSLTEVYIYGTSISSAESIGLNIFRGCSSLNYVYFQDYTVPVGNYMFKDCTALSAITLPPVAITTEAFYNTGLHTITVPEGVTEVGRSAFYGCSNLESVVLPSTITSIGDAAFAGTNLLAAVTINATTPPSLAGTSGTNASLGGTNVNIYVPASSLEDYKAAPDFVMYAQNNKIFAIQ